MFPKTLQKIVPGRRHGHFICIYKIHWFALTPESKNHSNHKKSRHAPPLSSLLAKFSRSGEDPKQLAGKDVPFKSLIKRSPHDREDNTQNTKCYKLGFRLGYNDHIINDTRVKTFIIL